jgi:hypothetical protein
VRSIRRDEVPVDPLPGRAVQRIVGRGASIASEEMTVGTARYADEFGPMEPHQHAEETIVVLEADRAWVRWGPARDELPHRIDLTPGLAINTPAWEWHVFEWQPGGHAEILVIYGQVDNIRPEDVGRKA